MTPPLHGITVIDQTQALAGPYCSMMLGDMGANVIKIERPHVGDQSRAWGPPFIGSESCYYLAVNRNKRSLTLDISKPSGQAILHRLSATADIFMTNLPSLAHFKKYQIDYATLSGQNPRLIFAAISGYGHSGPRAGDTGYDLVTQGEAGTMHLTGAATAGPQRFPTPIADMTTGLFTLIGILSALQARHNTGQGQFIDVSLLESQMTWLENYAGEYFASGEEPPKRGNAHPQVVPYEPVEASDGEWFILGVGSDNTWRKFCELAGRVDLRDDPRFFSNAERVRNREVLLPHVYQLIKTRPAAEWIELLKANGIPSGAIRNVSGALADPQVRARHVIVELEHPALGLVKSLATPIHLSHTPLSYRLHPPHLGENTNDILSEIGYTNDEIVRFKNQAII